MRLLYIHHMEFQSAMANMVQVKSMCTAMSSIGVDVILSLPESSNGCPALRGSVHNGWNLHFRERKFKHSSIDQYFNYASVRKTIKTLHPDICYLRSPLLLRHILPSNKPVIVELHQNILYRGVHFLDRSLRRVLKHAVKQGKVKKVVCISDALSEYWISEGIPRERVVTAHDGFDSGKYYVERDPSSIRSEIGFPQNKKIIAYTGSLYKNRKIENILELAGIFKDRYFAIIGGPEEQAEHYRNISRSMKLDNIIFTGRVPHEEIPKYLFASDILLALWSSDVPTIQYCSPLKLFEYMAAGRTIIAHAFPTIKEILQDGVNSILCKPDSFDDLVKSLELAILMPRKNKLADSARRDAFRKYSWDIRAKKILSQVQM